MTWDARARLPRRLATDDLPDECAVAVVGSGFGASVVAARLAGQVPPGELVVLERGRERVPGEFPTSFSEVRSNVRSRRNPLGLFELSLGRDVDRLVANGLGGGSLIYANVMLEPRADAFGGWPEAVDSVSLRPYFDRVRAVLRPEEVAGDVPKASALAALGAAKGVRPTRVPVAVNLSRPPGPDLIGAPQALCTSCGNCVTGCNVGAKTTMWASYLPMALAAGARIVTRAEVDLIRPSARPGRRWLVSGRRFSEVRGRVAAEPFELHADVVMIGAGAVGTTGILLRSAAAGLPVSAALGRRFSGNADSLAVSYNSGQRGSGTGSSDPFAPRPPVGPTITTALDLRHEGGGYLLQDGALPHGLAEAIRRVLGLRFALSGDKKIWCDLRPGGCPPGCGAIEHSQVWLAMGTDSAEGIVRLDRRGRPQISWTDVGRQQVYRDEAADLSWLSQGTEARHVGNPRHALLGAGIPSTTPVTVHPLGGAVMSDDPATGACDADGRVRSRGGEVHEGLYVTDGALVPTSTGANPALTIAALAERVAEVLASRDLPRLLGAAS